MREKTIIPAKTMQAMLMMKSTNAPTAKVQSKSAMPIPVAASGGINATAMAVPGKCVLSFGLIMANEAANPAMKAMTA